MNLKNFSSSSFFLGAERDSLKKWIPTMEMQYRGAVYREWCQGGLPEGKVHLILEDGRMYDGMWCYGKRSCPGTFYFNHGDVFQGSWRDDVIHGKGWFYFHTRDRWFANFWKRKASGKGCFYSKSGDVFLTFESCFQNLATANSVIWWYSSISPPVACSLEAVVYLVTWFRVISAGISREMANS
ncbi:hypothetical protein Peur_042350 [Populus x canadensis]